MKKCNRRWSIFFAFILCGLVACGDETPQQIIITLTTTEGEVSTYEVNIAEYDTTAPEVIYSYPKNGAEGITPEALHTNGITVVFSEPVTGGLYLLDGDDDMGWENKTDGNAITLIGPPFKGIIVTAIDEDEGGGYTVSYLSDRAVGYETLYIIAGKVADNAGNETNVRITFITSEFPL